MKYFFIFCIGIAQVCVATTAPIKAAALPSANLENFGTWSEKQSGLTHKIWRHSERLHLESLLKMPLPPLASPTLHQLALRLLVTSAEFPSPLKGSENLLETRAQQLVNMGEITHAYDLIKGFNGRIDPEVFHRISFLSLIAQGNMADAMKIALAHGPTYGTLFWHEALIFAKLMDESQHNSARLALKVYQEEMDQQDKEFIHLAESILNHKPAVSFNPRSFMKIKLALKTGNIPVDRLGEMPPFYVQLIIKDTAFKELPLITKAILLEHALLYAKGPESYGTKLEKIYDKIAAQEKCPFNLKQAKLGTGKIWMDNTALVRAHLYHLWQQASTDGEKQVYGGLLLQNAYKNGLLKSISYLVLPSLEPLPVDEAGETAIPYYALGSFLTQYKPGIEKWAADASLPLIQILSMIHNTSLLTTENIMALDLDSNPKGGLIISLVYPWFYKNNPRAAHILETKGGGARPVSIHPFYGMILHQGLAEKNMGESIWGILLSSGNIESYPLLAHALVTLGLNGEAQKLATEYLCSLYEQPPLVFKNPAPAFKKPLVQMKAVDMVKRDKPLGKSPSKTEIKGNKSDRNSGKNLGKDSGKTVGKIKSNL